MDERGNMVYHPQQQLLYAGLKKEEAGRLACLGDGTYVEDTVIYSVQRVPGSTWRVVGVSYIDETVNESFRQMVRITVITAGLVILAALAAGMMQGALPGMMAFCAGAMMQVVFAEMAPQAAKSRAGLFALMTGYALMMALDLALG